MDACHSFEDMHPQFFMLFTPILLIPYCRDLQAYYYHFSSTCAVMFLHLLTTFCAVYGGFSTKKKTYAATFSVASLPACEYPRSFLEELPTACVISNTINSDFPSLPDTKIAAIRSPISLRRAMSSTKMNLFQRTLDALDHNDIYDDKHVYDLNILANFGKPGGTYPYFVNSQEDVYCCSQRGDTNLRVLVPTDTNKDGCWQNLELRREECLFLKTGAAVQALQPRADHHEVLCKRLRLKTFRGALYLLPGVLECCRGVLCYLSLC